MSLIHHSNENYEEASSRAAKHGRDKLNGLIEKGRAQGQRVLEELNNMVIEDYAMKSKAMRFDHDANRELSIIGREKNLGVGKFARRQLLQEIKFPSDFYENLMGSEWGRDLATTNLNTIFGNKGENERRILRTVKDQVLGVVTPQYKPRDTGLLIESFLTACKKYDAQPYEARISESKFFLRMILPKVFEPVPNEPCAFVIHFGESEFGNGATVVSASLLRLACTNLAVFDNALREVHLGGGTNQDGMKWEKDTIKAMTQSTAKQLRDVVNGQFSKEGVDRVLGLVKEAHETKIDPWAIKEFLKKHTTAAEAKGITDAFNSGDVDMMPIGQTRLRLSNAISFFAQDERVNGERSEELQFLAGKVLTNNSKTKKGS